MAVSLSLASAMDPSIQDGPSGEQEITLTHSIEGGLVKLPPIRDPHLCFTKDYAKDYARELLEYYFCNYKYTEFSPDIMGDDLYSYLQKKNLDRLSPFIQYISIDYFNFGYWNTNDPEVARQIINQFYEEMKSQLEKETAEQIIERHRARNAEIGCQRPKEYLNQPIPKNFDILYYMEIKYKDEFNEEQERIGENICLKMLDDLLEHCAKGNWHEIALFPQFGLSKEIDLISCANKHGLKLDEKLRKLLSLKFPYLKELNKPL